MLYVDNASNNFNKLNKTKLQYYSLQVWRLMYLINSNKVYNTLSKKIHNRSTTIPIMFMNFEVFVYSGVKWLSRIVTKWSVGLKFGILSWNRKRAIYKSKQTKKKIIT